MQEAPRGSGEGTASCGDPAGHCGLMWYFLCAFTPDTAAHPTTNCSTFGPSVAARCHCGDNFAAVSILPNVKPWGNSPELLPTAQPPIHGPGLGLFREDGGYVSHVDEDGVGDDNDEDICEEIEDRRRRRIIVEQGQRQQRVIVQEAA